jgi:hypothetical protein
VKAFFDGDQSSVKALMLMAEDKELSTTIISHDTLIYSLHKTFTSLDTNYLVPACLILLKSLACHCAVKIAEAGFIPAIVGELTANRRPYHPDSFGHRCHNLPC